MKKKLISALLTIAMLTALLPTAFAANTVTRAEWISQLVEAFSMTVEDDSAMPDNYFSDISEIDSYYRDILLAVEFGVIDLEAGEAFEPNEHATREFAARTLNSCLQFQLDEGAEYTFSEAESVTYPDDIQIAINCNWFALSGGNFLPEQAITTAEATAMLSDAKSVIDSEVIDTSYDNRFEFAKGVIVVPETAQTAIDENNTVTITDNETEINASDVFVVFTSGIPVALKATAVEITDNTTVITATKDGAENAIVSADAQGRIAVDIENFEAEEATTYSITNTRTNETEEMEIQLYSIDYDEASKTVTASHNIKIGQGVAGSISAKISNINLDYKFKGMDYEAVLTGDTNVTTSVSFDFNDYAGIPKSITLGSVRVMGIGKISLDVECSISGGIAMSWDGALKVGVAGTAFKDARLIKSFTKKGFTITAEVNIGIGLKLSAGLDVVVLSGTLYATIGAKGSVKATGYSSGTPVECATIKAYMYASVGANVTICGWKAPIPAKDIFTESNSPIRVCYHYEDGKLVDKCTRGAAEAGDAYVTYTTPINSKHFNPSPSYAQGSYGGGTGSGGSTAEPVVIWEYTTDNDGNATITKYKGSASAVAIPSKIDGYTVTKIGSSAFRDNKVIRSVTIPDSVLIIQGNSFADCSTLANVNLSRNIDTIEGNAFGNCTALTSIFIPKSLNVGGRGSSGAYIPSGAFNACENLRDVEFEYGSTKVPAYIFANCTGVENVIIPDTVTKIEGLAFYMNDTFYKDQSKLKNITIPENITEIGNYAFYGCNALENIDIPDSVTKICKSAFANCTNLSTVNLSKNIDTIEENAFGSCTALTSIFIPKSLNVGGRGKSGSYIPSGAFNECDNLKTAILEEGASKVPEYLFVNCTGLEEVIIPDSVTTIGTMAFYMNDTFYKGQSKLKKVDMSENITEIGNSAFFGCNALENIDIPYNVTTIGNSVFYECVALKEISIPDSVVSLGTYLFYGCTNLEKVKLPNTIQNITSAMFYNCKNMIDIKLPETVTKINDIAFYGCTALAEITIPEAVTSIGNSALYECKALEEIIVPKNVTSIGNSAFENCDELKTAIVNSTGSIGQKAFYDCDSLTSLTVGDGITSIGSNMCYGCDNLTDISLGKYITTIPDSAFRLCQSLTSITLPRFCKTVAANAFAEDTKLVSAYVPNTVTKIENNSFSYPTKMTMYGKSGSYAEEYANSRNMTFNGTDVPITKLDYADNSIDIGRRDYIRPTLNIEPSFDTSTITFASSDENVCTISDTGEIYGNNYGTATITISSDSGVNDAITVNVVRLADSVSLDKTKLDLETGDTAKLKATLSPSDATDKITWSSSNESVATVDNGTVTAVGAGTAVITVTTTGGKIASCTVKVTGTFTVTATAGENGTISPSGEVSVKSDAKATFNILPDYGYVVKDVLVNGASVGAVESYTISNLTDNATITAEFAKVNAIYENNTITISSDAALKDLKLIFATYDTDGRLTNCEIKTITTIAGESYTETITESDNVKLMLWNGLNTMCPIWSNK